MDRITIDGIDIACELLGDAGAPGICEPGEAPVAGGKRVLLWDRPNCRASAISFDGTRETTVQGRALAALIRALDLEPTALAAGSAGARASLTAATQDPSAVSHLILWWIGGPISLAGPGAHHMAQEARVAAWSGMEAVTALPNWSNRSPATRRTAISSSRRIPRRSSRRRSAWAMPYRNRDDTPVPGVSRDAFATLTMPVLIFRNNENDIGHSAAATESGARSDSPVRPARSAVGQGGTECRPSVCLCRPPPAILALMEESTGGKTLPQDNSAAPTC